MATPKATRLLPPLHFVFKDAHRAGDAKKPLDLRDESGDRVISGRRGMGRHPVDENILREEVSANLQALLNTVQLSASEDLSDTPDVATSIINYGMPDLARLTLDDSRVANIASEIKGAMIAYEPRVDPQSIIAERDLEVDPASLNLRFKVYAELYADPLKIPVEFVAEVDSEFGKIRVERL
ncbi:MAG: type VI secretion system baseplate subunit TssE [Pseudomonadota bacterium]